MKKYAVIVAGGSGTRMGKQEPKQFLLLHNRPVIWYTMNVFLDAYNDLEIILVLPAQHILTGNAIIETSNSPARIRVITGGETRFQSVKNGLNAITDPSIIFVHDGVRCLLTIDLVHRCYDLALKTGNAIPAIAASDSIRIKNETGNEIIKRENVMIIQTPQTFHSKILKTAFEQEYDPLFTDEASVVERLGEKINLVDGETTNIKITSPIDLVVAEKILDYKFGVL